MSNWVYTRDIPFASHNPSADQPVMQTNTNSIDSLIKEDHYSFNDNNGGLHKQSTYVNETTPTTAAGQLALYSKGAPGGPSALYLVRDNNLGTETQLSSVTIGTAVAATTGASWLPGGLLIQWGSVAAATGVTLVNFLNAFTVTGSFPLPIVTVSQVQTGANPEQVIAIIVLSNTQFQIRNTGVLTTVYYMAIGAG